MVDVDRRMAGLNQAHAAALRRLSTRASSSSSSSSSSFSSASSSPAILRNSVLHSFVPLAEDVIGSLRSSGVTVDRGLSSHDFDLLEAEFSFQFPPDLRAMLSFGLPNFPGFPDWKVTSLASRRRLRSLFELPIAAVSLQITRKGFWSKRWGVRPSDTDRAVQIARAAIRRSPLLIPLFDRCYLPAFPCLAGNPVFMIGDSKISIAGRDLMDFFHRRSSSFSLVNASLLSVSKQQTDSSDSSSTRKTPRWIEFWSDAASHRRKRNSSSSSSSSTSSSSCSSSSSSDHWPSLSPPVTYVEIKTSKVPTLVGNYLSIISKALKNGGWTEAEIDEILRDNATTCTCDIMESDSDTKLNTQSVLDALLLNADRFSGKLRRAGWSSDEVSDALGFDFGNLNQRKREPATLPPEIVRKVSELAETLCRVSAE